MSGYDNNSTDHLPQFLAIFSNKGEYKVKVKIVNYEIPDASIADQTMEAHEINKLIDPETGIFFNQMYFDDGLFAVKKYEINLIKKWIKLTIYQPESLTK